MLNGHLRVACVLLAAAGYSYAYPTGKGKDGVVEVSSQRVEPVVFPRDAVSHQLRKYSCLSIMNANSISMAMVPACILWHLLARGGSDAAHMHIST